MEAGLFYTAPKSLFLAVLFGVGFAGMAGMFIGMLGMSGRRVRVVGSLFVMAGLMVLGGFGVVFGGLRVVGGGVLVAFSCLLRHDVGILYGPSLVRSTQYAGRPVMLHKFSS